MLYDDELQRRNKVQRSRPTQGRRDLRLFQGEGRKSYVLYDDELQRRNKVQRSRPTYKDQGLCIVIRYSI